MNRRKALQNVALLVGGTLSSSTIFALFESCNSGNNSAQIDASGGLFSPDQRNLIDEIVETIIPKTGTPGAKEAKVGEFIQMMVRECYPKKDQTLVLNGLTKFDADCKAQNQKSFIDLSVSDREKYLLGIEKDLFKKKENIITKIADDHSLAGQKSERIAIDAVNKMPEKVFEEPNHYYRILKELTLLGYFTSEPGATKALEYVKVPGKYIGSMPMKAGQKAWATD